MAGLAREPLYVPSVKDDSPALVNHDVMLQDAASSVASLFNNTNITTWLPIVTIGLFGMDGLKVLASAFRAVWGGHDALTNKKSDISTAAVRTMTLQTVVEFIPFLISAVVGLPALYDMIRKDQEPLQLKNRGVRLISEIFAMMRVVWAVINMAMSMMQSSKKKGVEFGAAGMLGELMPKKSTEKGKDSGMRWFMNAFQTVLNLLGFAVLIATAVLFSMVHANSCVVPEIAFANLTVPHSCPKGTVLLDGENCGLSCVPGKTLSIQPKCAAGKFNLAGVSCL